MWLFCNDSFLSIVAPTATRKTRNLLVRARREGDIERVFGAVKVEHTPKRDYAYRAFIARRVVSRAMADEVERISYTNFKNSVEEIDRHDAYLSVWTTMMRWGHGAFRNKSWFDRLGEVTTDPAADPDAMLALEAK
jgi:hypothetical protein